MSVIHGDCLEVMAGMEPETFDAIVTDPPYGLGFMGKAWDTFAETPNEARWNKRERNLTVEKSAMGTTGVTYADPNPRCAKCSKVRNGARRYVCQCGDDWSPAPRENRQAQRSQAWHQQWAEAAYRVAKPSAYLLAFGGTRTVHRMTVALEDAGWVIRDMLVWAYASGFPKSKASLKPAWEPIVMARKPGPLRMLAIDECRIPTEGHLQWAQPRDMGYGRGTDAGPVEAETNTQGRWPANVILTDPVFDGGIEGVVGGGSPTPGRSQNVLTPSNGTDGTRAYGAGIGRREVGWKEAYDDSGTYSRFFLIPKADRADREPVLGGLPLRDQASTWGDIGPVDGNPRKPANGHVTRRQNVHPTVKPVDLMRHLVRLVTPQGGHVLDPFLGSGTTGLACEMEGFAWTGIEREAEYVAIAEARLNGTQRGLGLESA